MQGPASFVVIQAQQIIIATNGVSGNGLFVYDPSPGIGNLIASIVAVAGTDPYTNTTVGGITGYDKASKRFVELSLGNVNFGSQNAATRITSAGQMLMGDALSDPSRPTIQINTPVAGAGLNAAFIVMFGESHDTLHPAQVYIIPTTLAGSLVPATTEVLEVNGNIAANLLKAIVAGVEEVWHTPALLNSFSAGGTAPRFQFEPVNGGRVRLSGAVNTGATNVALTPMFNLPAGYRPSRTLNFVTQNNITAYTLGSGSVEVHTNGDVVCVPASTAGKFVLIDGICFELD